MEQRICEAYIDQKSELLWQLAKKIWENPEIGYHEVLACQSSAELLRSEGFEVEVGAYGIPTAIRAVWSNGKPVIGFCGEYDALPGLSQKVSATKDPVAPGAPGQGCGHNLLGVACIGACIGLKAELENSGKEGTIIFYGCPAEELLTGKSLMAARGAFAECDVALAWHPGNGNELTTGVMTGLDGVRFHFHGRTAHAAANPQDGRSALDAVQLTNMGVEFLREHVTDDVRMHYVITDGGLAPNIVPDTASVSYFIRALEIDNLKDAYNRVVKCAEGAAHMTDTTLEVEHTGGCWPTLQNKVLCDVIYKNLLRIGTPEFSEEEYHFADSINRNNPAFDPNANIAPLNTQIEEPINANGFGSTDFGDVEHIVPGCMFTTTTSASMAVGHSWMNTACVGSTIGQKGMLFGAKAMAASAMDLIEKPALIAAAKAEFDEATKNETYVSFMGEDVKDPSVN